MSKFDKIIGYDAIKNELLQICDMLKNREIYDKFGAKLPHGILLCGDPGLGKSLMAECFIEECNIKAYTIRKNIGHNDFIGYITETFSEAKKNAPCIILLDDMDKFANEDDRHCDAEEYVAVQAGIDDVKHSDVFVIATVNQWYKLPDSLIRPGRFDKRIEFNCPTDKEAEKIIKHYLDGKKLADNVNIADLTKMFTYSSCSELETIMNDAAINAAFCRKDKIEMNDLVNSVLRMQYDSPDNFTKKSKDELKRTALHEAGHIVVSEVFCPGSIGLVSIRSSGRDSLGGFVHRCKEFERRPHHIIVSLAGKAAVELYYSDSCASGCQRDIAQAAHEIRAAITASGVSGLELINVSYRGSDFSESYKASVESVIHAELERYIRIARDIILKNRDFLEKITETLLEKETLIYSDIQKIKESVNIVKVTEGTGAYMLSENDSDLSGLDTEEDLLPF